MGGGSSIDTPRTPSPQFDRPIKRQNTVRSVHSPQAPSPKLPKKDTLQQPQQDRQTRPQWPLPHAKEENAFIPNDVEDKAQYSFRTSRYERVSQHFR
jgi:hypothetical protein